jgi:hypothetical protein
MSDLPTPPPSLADVYRKNAAIVHREIADENILVPVTGELAHLQEIFVVSPVAAFVWRCLDGRSQVAAIHHRLLEEFDVSREQSWPDLCELLATMTELRLIEPVESASTASVAAP